MAKRVFQIAYDEALMVTRELLLKNRGYEVVSVLGEAAAKKALSDGVKYDLFIVGHAAPYARRHQAVGWLKARFPEAKVLALNPPHYGGDSSADYNVPLNGPDEWLRAVASAIG
jgi:hypothetical protein